MGQVERSVKQEGAPEVRHSYLRSLLKRLRLEGCERPPVVHCMNCKHVNNMDLCSTNVYSMEEAAFTRGLKILFIVILTAAVINLTVYNLLWELTRWLCVLQMRWERIVPLVIFATIVAGSFMEKMRKSIGSVPKRGQVQTI